MCKSPRWNVTLSQALEGGQKGSQHSLPCNRDGSDVPGDLVVKMSSSNTEGVSSIPGGEVKIPHASRPKKQKLEAEAINPKGNQP